MQRKIRAERPADIAAIEQVVAAAFATANHTSRTEQFIVNALRRAGQLTISLVAEQQTKQKTEIVGHVAISPVTISSGASDWFGLGPLSVAPAWQRQGIGDELMREALTELRRQGAAGCVVLGEPGYYGCHGFRSDPRLTLAGVPPEYFQVVAFGDNVPNGTVTYHEAFDATC